MHHLLVGLVYDPGERIGRSLQGGVSISSCTHVEQRGNVNLPGSTQWYSRRGVTLDWLRDELGMTFGVDGRQVDPRVHGGVIDVVSFSACFHVIVEVDGIGASSARGVSLVEGVDEFQGGDVGLDVWTGLFELGLSTFPHFHRRVPFGMEMFNFLLGFPVHIGYGLV